jgi:hypothetical protein
MRRALGSRFVPARGCRDPHRPWRKSATQRTLPDLTSKLFHGQGNKPPPSFVYMTKRATCVICAHPMSTESSCQVGGRELVSGRGSVFASTIRSVAPCQPDTPIPNPAGCRREQCHSCPPEVSPWAVGESYVCNKPPTCLWNKGIVASCLLQATITGHNKVGVD